ncbi:unnamed protein product, partial [Brassica oleracea]
CLFLVIFKFLFFVMLCFFSQQNLAKPNYLIQNLALMMVQNTKTTGIRSIDFLSMRGKISLCYISRRRFKTLLWDLLTSTRTTGQPVVDDWDCYKTLVKSFKNQCGAKMEYDMKYAGALANICNKGVDVRQTVAAIEEACAH